MTLKKLFLYLLVLSTSYSAFAEIPTGYYKGTESLKGKALKKKLHNIIKGHKSYSYKQLWKLLAYTDEYFDENNPNKKHNTVYLIYSEWQRHKNNHGGQPSQWNREHTWAKFRGNFGKCKPEGTDLHHIRATDVTVNSKRGHLDFDAGGKKYIDGDGPTNCRVDHDSWEPPDSAKGDVARMLFYMAVRYEGSNREKDLELTEHVQKNSRRPLHGKLSTLLKWHKQDPPDAREKRRHERIFEKQGNRNPFIDHPEFAEKVWHNS